MSNYSFLLNSVESAREVAFVLKGTWDGCNGVNLADCDYEALKLATALCNAEYCEMGGGCLIHQSPFDCSGPWPDMKVEAIGATIADCFNHKVEEGGQSFWQGILKVAQDFAELDQQRTRLVDPVATNMTLILPMEKEPLPSLPRPISGLMKSVENNCSDSFR